MSEKKDIFWRAYLIYFGFVIIMLVVLIKTITIQFEGGKPYFLTSTDGNEKMPTRVVKRTPRRGQILDVNYTPLVTSVSFYDIHMDPQVPSDELFNDNIHALCEGLHKMFPSTSTRQFEERIRKGKSRGSRYVLIARKVTNQQRKQLRELPIFEKGRLKGGIIDNEEIIIRKRPLGSLMQRTLGYVRVDGNDTSMVGLEGAFNNYLIGEPGEEIEQKISTGWKKIGPVIKDPIEGANVVTTIDKEIQEVAHSELMKQLVSQQAQTGCVIVMDVKTGYVKAIVNLRKGTDGNYYESYNKAIGVKEVPGSTFKLASLMAALEDDKVTINDIVNAKGVYKFYNSKQEDSHHGGYGMITIQQAFEKSSNVFSEIINDAYKDNPQAFVDRLKSFGLGDSLGIKIKGEPKPTLYEPGMPQWSGLSLPWMAIGYEVQQTPLQTLTFYNAVANKGTMVQPQFVKEIMRGNEVVETFAPKVMIDHICSDQTLADVQTCLKGVVKRGTGQALQSAYFDIAGKTGTSRILDNQNTMSSDAKYQASFAGYFPADDPIYSCIVVISAPTKNIYGAVVSGTVFTAIANKVYASSLQYHKPVNHETGRSGKAPISADGYRYDLEKVYDAFGINYKPSDASWVNTIHQGKTIELTRRYIGAKTVPNVIGMTAKDAVYLIERTGMVAKVSGYGIVVKQSMNPGEPTVSGQVISVELK